MKNVNERERLATRYLKHTALGGLAGRDLDEAETTYVLWDWDGLALLAYVQFLKHGRGAFLGPRTTIDKNGITVAFDYVLGAHGSIAEALGQDLAASLRAHIDHYHPELDFIVVWLRNDRTARYEVLRSNDSQGLRSPRELYEQRRSEDGGRPS